MLRTRVMPCLLLRNRGLVKTVRFDKPRFVGDPINTVRIFNEKEVDELIFLDITATVEGKQPQFELLQEIASECFMPFTYGGGVTSIEDMQRLFQLGVEKVALCSAAFQNPSLVERAAERFGNQAVVVALDVRKNRIRRGYSVFVRGGRTSARVDPRSYAEQMQRLGAGELLLTSIDRDGTGAGYDLELISEVSGAVDIPVIACGGARSVADFAAAVGAGADAVAAGSMVVYQGQNRGVLISFPSRAELSAVLS